MGAAMVVDGAAHRAAGPARAAMWFQLVGLFEYPSETLIESARSGRLSEGISEAAAGLPYGVTVPAFDVLPPDPPGMGSEYIRLFDVPSSGTPCPLYLGALGGDRRTAMEDLLRFYRHFGLSVVHAEERDLPDSVPTVLEFMGYLVEREQVDPRGGGDERRAQRDLIQRHLVRGASVIRERVSRLDPPAFYAGATGLLEEVVHAEAAALAAG
jgi:DMSO reductase family type II enzyme chaperone